MLLLLLACAGDKTPGETGETGLPTPEEIVATAADGDAVTFQGEVHTVTFDSTGSGSGEDGEDNWSRLPGRWMLVRSAVPEGIDWDNTSPDDIEDDDRVALAWTLGVSLADGVEAARIGESVVVSGTYTDGTWNGHPLPIIEDASFEVSGGLSLAGEGESCSRDADCLDSLVCDRASALCAPPLEQSWDSLWRDVDGHCYSDDDCPTGQVCDTDWVVPDSGDYTWRYDGSDKLGASLCVPEQPEDALATCGRIDSPRDLAGGRPVEGKELCVQGTVHLAVHAEDGDTHVQLEVDEPLPYPAMDAPIRFFGATTEIGPPYKSPDRPEGALLDPTVGDEIIALGTLRWDSGHGWYEIHPLKAWWPVSSD